MCNSLTHLFDVNFFNRLYPQNRMPNDNTNKLPTEKLSRKYTHVYFSCDFAQVKGVKHIFTFLILIFFKIYLRKLEKIYVFKN